MDQRRLIRLELDTTFLSRLCGQSGSTAIVHPGLQSGQLPAAIGVTPEGEALVFDHLAGETGEDRSQSRESLRLCHFSDGRGGSAADTIQGDSGADWTIVAASTAGEDGMTVHYIEKIDIKTNRNSQGAHLSIGMAPMRLEKSEIYSSIGQIHVKRCCIALAD